MLGQLFQSKTTSGLVHIRVCVFAVSSRVLICTLASWEEYWVIPALQCPLEREEGMGHTHTHTQIQTVSQKETKGCCNTAELLSISQSCLHPIIHNTQRLIAELSLYTLAKCFSCMSLHGKLNEIYTTSRLEIMTKVRIIRRYLPLNPRLLFIRSWSLTPPPLLQWLGKSLKQRIHSE